MFTLVSIGFVLLALHTLITTCFAHPDKLTFHERLVLHRVVRRGTLRLKSLYMIRCVVHAVSYVPCSHSSGPPYTLTLKSWSRVFTNPSLPGSRGATCTIVSALHTNRLRHAVLPAAWGDAEKGVVVDPLDVILWCRPVTSSSLLLSSSLELSDTTIYELCIRTLLGIASQFRKLVVLKQPTTLPPNPYTSQPTPHALHPTPYTLHPLPYIPQPTP